MIPIINPSSKVSLKMSCLQAAQGDVDKAAKLYQYLSEGVESMPDFDMPKPTVIQQVKSTLGESFNWLKENQNDIMQGVQWVRAMFGKDGGMMMPPPGHPPAPPAPIPPIE